MITLFLSFVLFLLLKYTTIFYQFTIISEIYSVHITAKLKREEKDVKILQKVYIIEIFLV